jgi:hypothetical protein
LPNHITNNTVVIGTPENIRRFVAEAFIHPGQFWPDAPDEINDRDIPVLCFNLIVPPPENIEKGGCNGKHEEGEVCWYNWNLENWGTKWGAYSHDHYGQRLLREYSRTGEGQVYGRVDLTFDTAWSQPTPIFAAIEQRWDVAVHCVSQDEGGFPDTEYGDPYGEELLHKVVTFEFDTYDTEVDESAVSS